MAPRLASPAQAPPKCSLHSVDKKDEMQRNGEPGSLASKRGNHRFEQCFK